MCPHAEQKQWRGHFPKALYSIPRKSGRHLATWSISWNQKLWIQITDIANVVHVCVRVESIYLDRLRTADFVEMDLTLDAMSLYHIARFTSGFLYQEDTWAFEQVAWFWTRLWILTWIYPFSIASGSLASLRPIRGPYGSPAIHEKNMQYSVTQIMDAKKKYYTMRLSNGFNAS